MEKHLSERFEKIGVFGKGVLSVFDCRHAVEEFHNWFPKLTLEDYRRILAKGVKTVLRDYGLISENYMIIDRHTQMRIPLEVREDQFNPGYLIGVVATTLAPHETNNLRNEVEVFVEKCEYARVPITEGYNYAFNYYSDKGRLITNFEEIEV